MLKVGTPVMTLSINDDNYPYVYKGIITEHVPYMRGYRVHIKDNGTFVFRDDQVVPLRIANTEIYKALTEE